jgi:hypothetical protein
MATKKEKNYSDTKEGQDYLKERKEKAAKIEMVSKLAARKKGGEKKTTDTEYALSNFNAQKGVDKMVKENKNLKDVDYISDETLSNREGSFKHGGLVKLRSGKPKLAKKGWK